MFIGHFAVGLASRKIDQSPSLAVMFVAVQFLDLLWPLLVLLGIETLQIDVGNTQLTPLNFTSYPYSHSLLTTAAWGLLFGLVYYGITKHRKGSVLLFVLVVSHRILDFITHRPDLPLSPFSDLKVGLGLWNSPVAESILEIGMFIAGALLYVSAVQPKRKIAFWSLIVVFLAIHILNLLGPPPPSESAVAWSANLMWLFVIWAWWIEKKKTEVHAA
jgi:membrane-bound metal-dependent hydrolase YbcI (DUF457 family)